MLLFAPGLHIEVEDQVLSHPVLQEELHNPKNGDAAHKHLEQQVCSQWSCDHRHLLSR